MGSSKAERIQKRIQDLLKKNQNKNPNIDNTKQLREIVDEMQLFREEWLAQKEELERLRIKNGLLETITDNMFDLVALTDIQGHFIFVGKSHQILGYELDSLVGRNVLEFVHPEDLPRVESVFRNYANNPQGKQIIEYRYRCSDDHYIWLETVEKIVNEGNNFLFSSRNITIRKKAEEELAQQKTYTESIIAAIPDLMFVINKKKVFVDLNAGHSKDLFLPREKFIGKKMEVVLPGPVSAEFSKGIEKVFAGQKVDPIEYELPINGEMLTFEARLSPLGKDKVIGLVRNMTREKIAERAAKESNRRFNQLAKQSRTITWEVDADGTYTFISEGVKQVLGYEPKEIIRKINFYDFHCKKMQESFKEMVFELFKRKAPFTNLENKVMTKNGEEVWFSTNGIPILDRSGKLKGYRGINTDITFRKKTEEVMEANDILLRKLSEQLPGFIYQFQYHPDGRNYFPFASKNIWHIFEVTPEEVKRDAAMIFSRIHPDDYKRFIHSIKYSFSSLKDWKYNFRVNLPEKGERWLHGNAHPEKQKDNSVIWYGFITDFTDQKKLEIELKNAKERFELSINGTNDGIWDWNIQTNTLFLSKRWKEMLGYEDHELQNEYNTFSSLIFSEDFDRVVRYIDRYLKGEIKKYLIEFRMKHKDGSLRWILAKGEAICDKYGIPFRMAGSHSDITEKKMATQEIMDTKEKLELSLDSGYIAWWIWDYETGIVQTDRKKAEMLGYTQEEFPKNFFDVTKMVHPEDYEIMMQNMRDLFKGKSDKYFIDYRIKAKSGEWRWFSDRGTIVKYTADGKPKKISGVVIDITDSKRADAKLKKMASLQNILMNMASEYINIKISDIEHGIEHSLEKLSRFIKADRAQILDYDWEKQVLNSTWEWHGKNISAVKIPLVEVPLNLLPDWLKSHTQNKPVIIPDLQKLPSESPVRIMFEPQGVKSMIAIPIMDDKKCIGAIEFVNVRSHHIYTKDEITLLQVFSQIFLNLRKRFQAEKNLLIEKEKANAANRSKSEFLANMSHEIRTPMNSILGFSEIMLNTTTDPKQKAHLKTILSSGKTLLSLINDILDLSKIEAQKMKISPELANLRMLMKEIKDLFQPAILGKDVRFILEIDEKLPPAIVIDEVRLKQILLNLAGNAVKFTHKGFVKISTKVLNDHKGIIDLEIAVTDTGIGIPEKDQKRIFESFSQQSARNTKEYGGTGLGLTISKRLCELMKGEIEVESTLGKGSQFMLRFTNLKYTDEVTEEEALYSWEEEDIEFKGSKIMIVDDVSHNRQLALAYLDNYNLDLYEAENGQMAVEMAKTILPDLILMDIRMPGINGYEAKEEIKGNKTTAAIPIVALTASTMQNEIEKLRQNFDGYLRKPVNKKSMIKEIIKHLPYEKTRRVPSSGQKKPVEMQTPGTATIISEELKEAFRKEFSDKISDLTTMIIIDDINILMNQLRNFARKYQITQLTSQTNDLERAVEAFDVMKIRHCLKSINKMFH
jgi:PAS domain S-box-containing protein